MSNAFVHIELNTGDLKKAKAFYKKIFAWKLEDMPMGPGMTYTMVQPGKGTGGGMQDKNSIGMSKAPTMWLPYVEVDDVKKTIAKAKKAGAKIVVEYQAIPGMGGYGMFVDPTGAPLGVWEMSKKPARRQGGKKKAAKKKAAKKKA